MAPFDFPNFPDAGQIVIGPDGQNYRWDGHKWVFHITPARFVQRAGDSMVGPLFLHDDAKQPLEPVTLRQMSEIVDQGREVIRRAREVIKQLTDFMNTSLVVSDTAPDNPRSGQLWFNSADTQLYVYFSGQWVVTVHNLTPPGTAGNNPPGE